MSSSRDIQHKHAYDRAWQKKNRAYATQKMREFRAAHPEYVVQERVKRRQSHQSRPIGYYRRTFLKRMYNLSLEDFDVRLAAQDGRCAICRKVLDLQGTGNRPNIDHDHRCCPKKSCGRCVRGLLCSACNRVLGIVKDDVELLLRFIDYVQSHRKSLALRIQQP